jgi:hypothetical protein
MYLDIKYFDTKDKSIYNCCTAIINTCMINHIIKEMTMFTVDTVVDQATKNTKTVLGYIPNEDVRASFESLVDAQATYTKIVMNTATDLAKLATENVTKFVAEAQKVKK